jgi:transcriptional regulator with XRE-family HTH domain
MKKLRKRAGISQQKLAELCGTAPTYIRQIETGIKCPSLNYVGKIAEALRVSPHQLFYYDTSLEEDYIADERLEHRKTEEQSLIEIITREIHCTLDKLTM